MKRNYFQGGDDRVVKKKTSKAKKGNAKKRRYGWVPDLPDQRDHLYSAVRVVPAVLPSAFDLRPQCPPVENQGDLGSCTGNALAGSLEFLEKKDNVRFVDLSRRFI